MSLRHRLMLLYALMALAPALLGTGAMLLYLRSQVRNATRAFQRETQATLSEYQRKVEASSQQLLQQAFAEVSQQTQRGLEQGQQQMAHQQEALIGRALRTLNQRTSANTAQLQYATRQTLQRTLDSTARQIGAQQARALEQLANTATQASRDAIRQQVTQSSLSLTTNLGRQLDGILRSALAQLTLIAQQPALREARLLESRWILQALQDREPSYRLLCLRNAQGERLLTVGDFAPPEGALQPLVESLWAQMVQSEQPVIGQVLMVDTGAGEEPLIPVLAPVRERGVELRGAVGALIAMDDLNQLVRTFRMGKQGYAMLCGRDGLVLAHPAARQIGTREERWIPLIAPVLDAMQPRLQEVDGSLVTLAPVANLNACLIVIQPTEEAFQLATVLQEQFAHARTSQQGELQNAIRQTSRQATQQVNRQMDDYQRTLQATLQNAERQTLNESKQSLNAQHRASREQLTRLLNTKLNTSQRQLQQELSRLSRLSDLSDQFNGFTATLQRQIADQILNALLVVLFGVLMLSMLGSVYLYRTLNLPLRSLMEATRVIAQGDLSQRVQLPTRNAPELQQLADSFNHMVDALAKAEAQLIQSSKLASLGTLASGVAHELNQPLAIIRGIAQQTIQMLQKGDPGVQHAALLEDMRLIERQTQRMSQIIMHLRTFARKPREGKEPVNLNEVAQNALILLREQLHQRGIDLIEEYEPNLSPALGEPNSLEQVVINLLTNARDALEGQAQAQVQVRTRSVQDSDREWVELIVQDNGPGVPPDLRTQIFDPFFTTKEPGKGTGLGLAISLEIAQKHGGTLLLEDSAEGTGACFILRLPAASQQRQVA